MMSGPVAGLIGGIWAGKMAGYDNVFTLDIGGTSADIGVAAGGALRMRHLLDTKIGDYQAMIPMVRYRHHRGGRRLHRLCRRRRHLPRRPAIGGRRSGPRLLRPRRQRAHLDRRSGGARPAPHRSRPGRRADDAARGPRPRGRPESRRHARHVAGGDRARRAADPEVQHGAGHRAQQRAARLRPARLHARRCRRRRPALRLRHRGGTRNPAGPGAAASRHSLGHAGCWRPTCSTSSSPPSASRSQPSTVPISRRASKS